MKRMREGYLLRTKVDFEKSWRKKKVEVRAKREGAVMGIG